MKSRSTLGLVASGLALAILVAAGPVSAEGHQAAYESSEQAPPSVYSQAVDLALVRPLFLVPIVVSGVGCAMGLPLTLFLEEPVEVERICWRAPVNYTFTRPLGRF